MKGCCSIALPFLIPAFIFMDTLVNGVDQPFSELLSQAGSNASLAFEGAFIFEIFLGVCVFCKGKRTHYNNDRPRWVDDLRR